MCEDLNDKIDDIYPVDQKTCLETLKKASLVPDVPFAAIYTLRLLAVAFFRDRKEAALVADEELEQMYTDVDDEIVEAEHETEFREEDFTRGGPEIVEVIVGPERPMRSCVIHPDEILGPAKIRCD